MRLEREMQKREDGYWWAIGLHPESDGEPEIIDVLGLEATRLGDSWLYHVGEFVLLQRVDTSRWPQKGKLTEEELLDENYAVDPAKVHEGYWWALDCLEESPQIILVGKNSVQAFAGDIDRSLDEFEFLMPIDTSGWPKE
ncbi:MAG: hypothetical protein E5Y88_22315 [Mesorhizobium sp.]|uniref:hypothetical protein n=1 Tax=Mesorhizobium sp. TaxID=1871066 RepID=UPI0012073C7A|nr:hypothetical protein [Mesorhizobium sp.]TIL23664.1 MAG: hypothetical protein E5Y88_22315 [Mesorhizobium sp.]